MSLRHHTVYFMLADPPASCPFSCLLLPFFSTYAEVAGWYHAWEAHIRLSGLQVFLPTKPLSSSRMFLIAMCLKKWMLFLQWYKLDRDKEQRQFWEDFYFPLNIIVGIVTRVPKITQWIKPSLWKHGDQSSDPHNLKKARCSSKCLQSQFAEDKMGGGDGNFQMLLSHLD